MHAGSTDAADLFLVGENAAGRAFRILHFQNCPQARICADTVIMSIPENHRTIKSVISCFASRNDFNLSRDKIIFLDVIFLFQKVQQILLDRIFFFACHRNRTSQHVESFTLYHRAAFLLHLLCGQMDQQIRNADNRIIRLLADVHEYLRTILAADDAMQRHRSCDPLILLDAAVVMRIQQNQSVFFIKRMLLEIHARAVDMRTENIHAFGQRLISDDKQA